jgi:protein O-mannosyl-transferase
MNGFLPPVEIAKGMKGFLPAVEMAGDVGVDEGISPCGRNDGRIMQFSIFVSFDMAAKSKIKSTPRANAPSAARQEVTPLSLKQIFASEKVYILVLALVAFLLYILSVNNGYNLDDELVTKDHPFVSKGVAGIPDILTSPWLSKGDYVLDYRPIAQITYAIERSVFGESPAISHFINVLLYALLCMVMYMVLRYIFPGVQRELIWLGSLLFSVHPLHSEIVNSLKSRDELFSLMFGLGFLYMAVHIYRSRQYRVSNLVMVFLLILLSLMSKQSSLPLIVFFAFYVFYYEKGKWTRPAVWGLPFAYLMFWLVYLILVNKVFFPIQRTFTYTEFPLPDNATIVDHLNIIIPSIFFYVKMMIWPYPLSSFYGYNTLPPEVYKTIVVLLFVIVSLWLFFTGFKERRFWPLIIAWFVIPGGMYYNIFIQNPGIVSERAAFIMSIPGSLGIVMLFGLILQRKDISVTCPSKLTTFLIYGLTAIFGLISFFRIGDWKDPVTLYAKDLTHYPNSAHLNFLQGVNYDIRAKEAKAVILERKYIDTAYFHFNRVLSLQPDRPIALTYVGRYFIDYYDNLDSAHTLLSRAWGIRERGETAYELGRVKTFLGRWDEALPILEQATVLDTTIYWAWYFLAQAYYEQGDLNKALAANENLKEIQEMAEYYHLNAGNFYYRSGEVDMAIPWLRKAVENGTRDPRLLQELSSYYAAKGDKAALQWLKNLPSKEP